MSRIYFHSQSGEAELRGSERAWMGVLCSDLLVASLGGLQFDCEWIKALLPPHSYVVQSRDFAQSIRLYLSVGDGKLIVDGEEIDAFTLALNTAWVIGGNPLRLMARLHGQCEIHCWVAGKNRKWLAGIIAEGRASGLYRAGQGWESVAGFLLSNSDEPVVCSYSVCDSFPNLGCLPESHPLKGRTDDERFEVFDELSDNEKWALCLKGLQERTSGSELTPRHWKKFFFGRGHTAFSLPRTTAAAIPTSPSGAAGK